MFSRRGFVSIPALALPFLLDTGSKSFSALAGNFAQLERTNGGRLGITVLDTATGECSEHRADERFPMT
jgi:beta-lactamase class A